MNKLLAALLLLVSLSVNAGYYVKMVSIAGGVWPSYASEGKVSNCYLTPSMAIASLDSPNAIGWRVMSMDADGNWSAMINYWGSDPIISGQYYSCTATPLVRSFPTFAGGVVDPAITDTGVSSGASSSSGADAATVAALQSTVASLQTTIATNQSSLQTLLDGAAASFDPAYAWSAFSFFYCVVIVLWAMAKGGGMVLSAIRDKRH